MHATWLRRVLAVLSLIVTMVIPLLAQADRVDGRQPRIPERLESMKDTPEAKVKWVEPKRTIMTFDEHRVEVKRATPKLQYPALFEPPSFPRSKRTLIRLRKNFDDRLLQSIAELDASS